MSLSATSSLYEAGWRQGTSFSADLPAYLLDIDDQLLVSTITSRHARWIVATQDCDLDNVPVLDNSRPIEIRPLHPLEGSMGWGIRSRKLRISNDEYVDASDPHSHTTARLLAGSDPGDATALSDGRALAFKTWLGLRYDRPAVPENLVPLAREISRHADNRRSDAICERLHDVLMQFVEVGEDVQFALVAVITNPEDRDQARRWLAEIAADVSPDLGVAAQLVALTRDELSLQVLENSYAADTSAITWKGEIPSGAT